MQADAYRSALARLEAAAAEVPNAIVLLLEEVGADEHWSSESSDAAVDSLRSGRTVKAGREVWHDNDLPEEAYGDLLRRLPHFDALPPLGEVLRSISWHTEELAAALRNDAGTVLEASHDGDR
jgi:hypothetical protein